MSQNSIFFGEILAALVMNQHDVEKGVNIISANGSVLSAREIACLSASITEALSSHKISDIIFWGRVSADQDDYYVCYGLKTSKNIYPNKKFLWT
jgi:hypothetical protein